jgi:hypothetical protein
MISAGSNGSYESLPLGLSGAKPRRINQSRPLFRIAGDARFLRPLTEGRSMKR